MADKPPLHEGDQLVDKATIQGGVNAVASKRFALPKPLSSTRIATVKSNKFYVQLPHIP